MLDRLDSDGAFTAAPVAGLSRDAANHRSRLRRLSRKARAI